MNEQDLVEIEERASRATPGEWEFGKYFGDWNFPHVNWVGKNMAEAKIKLRYGGKIVCMGNTPENRRLCEQSHNDAEFIAHARSDVPALVAEVRRLREELAATSSPTPSPRPPSASPASLSGPRLP